MDDLDFKVKDVALDLKVFNRYVTFDSIANTSMENSSSAYFHFDLLDKVALTIIVFTIKLVHIDMYE
jgi:hypothetical protein